MIGFLADLHERGGRLFVTLVAMGLLATARWTDVDATTLVIIVSVYVGGASGVRIAQEVKVTRKR